MYPGPDCLYTDERAAAVALARPRSRPTCPNRKLVQKKNYFFNLKMSQQETCPNRKLVQKNLIFFNKKNSRPRKI